VNILSNGLLATSQISTSKLSVTNGTFIVNDVGLDISVTASGITGQGAWEPTLLKVSGTGTYDAELYTFTPNKLYGLKLDVSNINFPASETTHKKYAATFVGGSVGIGTHDPESGTGLHVNGGSILVNAFDTANTGIFFRQRFNSSSASYITTNKYNLSIFSYDHNNSGHYDGLSMNAYDGISFCTGHSVNRQQRMIIQQGGNVVCSGTLSQNSDITLKENLEVIEEPIEKIKQINGYTFNMIDNEEEKMVGLVAQEVEEILPELVSEDNDGIKSLAYGNMVALLVECIKKQDERIESLEKKIEELS
jgi:cell division protein ZapA (FtsZ GTPase activity inhibitor)